MTNKQVMEKLDAHVMGTYGRFPVAIEKGSGATLYDFEGKKYIDFSSGIGVNSLGMANEAWAKAIYDQALKLGHISNLYYTEPCAVLAETLCRRTGMEKVFFANSGAESNEGAIKLARKYSFDRYGSGRSTIVTLRNSFHGRTVTTLAATGQNVFHNYFFPFTEGFRHAPAGDLAALERTLGPDCCAVMLELVQGEGGVYPLEREYIRQVAALCQEKDLLLLVDEVQTGVGRTGSLFAFQQYGIRPDVVTFAKGIAGGLPFGGFMAGPGRGEVLSAGTHATTFGGNPICAAAAQVVLETMDAAFLQAVREKGAYVKEKVLAFQSPYVADVRGMGLMLGVQLRGLGHKELVAALIEKGLLALTAGSDTLRLLPPLNISYEEIDAGLTILEAALKV